MENFIPHISTFPQLRAGAFVTRFHKMSHLVSGYSNSLTINNFIFTSCDDAVSTNGLFGVESSKYMIMKEWGRDFERGGRGIFVGIRSFLPYYY
jgi:hypothetical protein